MAEHQELPDEAEEALQWSDFRSLGCALGLLLLVVGGGVTGARLAASWVDGGVLVYLLGLIGAILGAVIVGLFALFVVFPIIVMGSHEDARFDEVKRLQNK